VAAMTMTAGAQDRRSERAFSWDGSIPEGRWLYVRNLNGAVRVERGAGSRVEVTATKRWRRSDPDDVRIEQKKDGDDIVICAIWTDNSRCDADGYSSRGDGWRRNRNNDVSVDFVISLPPGVKLGASTVNGALDIRGASSTVEASTVNGGIDASTSGGPIRASTVNGSIVVKMGEVGDRDLDFETVNGSIEVWVPDKLNADVTLKTVNGRVSSDFPMTLSGRINPRHLRAKIGDGGPRITLSTVNGSVELRKN
jgi:hypothetical protein